MNNQKTCHLAGFVVSVKLLSIVASFFGLFLVSAFFTSFWFVVESLFLVEFLFSNCENEILATILAYKCSFFHFNVPPSLKYGILNNFMGRFFRWEHLCVRLQIDDRTNKILQYYRNYIVWFLVCPQNIVKCCKIVTILKMKGLRGSPPRVGSGILHRKLVISTIFEIFRKRQYLFRN